MRFSSSYWFVTFLILGLGVALSARATTPVIKPGFPVGFGRGMPVRSLTLADIDGRGGLEIVATVAEGVAVVGSDGKVWPGFPKGLRDAAAKTPIKLKGPPAVCDLDGDGRQEILVGGSSRMVYAVNAAGTEVPGFPVAVTGNPRGAISCLPVKGQRRQDVVLTTDAGLLVVIAGRGGSPRTLAKIGRGAESGVAVADLDGNGILDVVAGGGDSRLYVVDTDGKRRKGFPYKMSFRTSGIPAIGDIDDDGKPDIVFGSQDFKIHALGADGKSLAGFPMASKYRIYAGVALADVDGDWVLDLVVGSGDKKLYAFRGTGKSLRGFPSSLNDRVEKDSAIGDVDRDGRVEIFTVTERGSLYRHRYKQKARILPVKGKIVAGPVLGDLDGDGVPEIVVATKTHEIVALGFEATGRAKEALLAWPMAGHDSQHSGRLAPNPARFKDLAYVDGQPPTSEPLQIKYQFFDLDWETEGSTQIRWYRDGKHLPELDNARHVEPRMTRKHQRWSYTLQGADNFKKYGESGILARVYRAQELRVKNTPPTAPGIALGPADPRTTSPLDVKITAKATDADGDSITYRYVWLKDGKMHKLKGDATRVPATATRKNQQWRIVVVPFDGEEEGEPATATLTIRNTPPGAPQVAIEPAQPRIDDAARTVITRAAPDDDSDKISYTFRYWVNGQLLRLPEVSDTIPARALRKHQKVRVEVTAHDDEEAGGRARAELEVQNTVPPPPAIVIWPAEPRTGDDLHLGVRSQKPDADGDRIVLEHQWTRDGTSVTHPTVVPASLTHKGQMWRIAVTPFDGEHRGKQATAQARIVNTPPDPPQVTLPRYTFFTDERIEPVIGRAATDADGDTVHLKYEWSVGGKRASLPESKGALDPSATGKGQRWTVRIVPHDGEAAGRPVELHFAIKNSLPSPPEVALSTERSTARDVVSVKVTKSAHDKDKDRLTYRYRWYRDGQVMVTWPDTKTKLLVGETRKGQRWHVEVRAFDGEAESEPAKADLEVVNHAPEPPKIVLVPSRPTTLDDLECKREKPGKDVDGDKLSYRTRWFVDRTALSISSDQEKLPATMTREKQSWRCEMTTFDGELTSTAVGSNTVTINNTPPDAPVVSIAPARPTTDEDLTCQLDRPAQDADVDTITYRFVWRLNNKRWQGKLSEPHRIPAAESKRGQTWECLVTPSDGEIEGPLARARVTIGNSPPTTPIIHVNPEQPKAGQRLTCKIEKPSTDIDGDKVSYSFVWLKDGIKQSFARTSTSVPGRLVKGKDMWQCRVTPNDGIADGTAVTSEDVVVSKK